MMELGESFVGAGAEAAHVNTVLGPREGPVGHAWATALATPREGHAAFVAVLQPGLPAQPFTLFVNKATIASDVHARLTWGPAQAGVAAGVADTVANGVVSELDVGSLVVIAAVWVDPAAVDGALVFANNRAATAAAIAAGRSGHPSVTDVLGGRDAAWNPFFRAPGLDA
jgi:5,6,7,8-tetrahydromethanopterin hydro-lyase